MISQHGLEKLQLISIHPTAARTSTGNGSAIDLLDYDGDVVIILDSAAAGAGTNPTLDIKVQSSATSNGTYADVSGAAFTQVTDAASRQKLVVNRDETARYIRIVYTIGGTNAPSFTFSVNAVGVKKYG